MRYDLTTKNATYKINSTVQSGMIVTICLEQIKDREVFYLILLQIYSILIIFTLLTKLNS